MAGVTLVRAPEETAGTSYSGMVAEGMERGKRHRVRRVRTRRVGGDGAEQVA